LNSSAYLSKRSINSVLQNGQYNGYYSWVQKQLVSIQGNAEAVRGLKKWAENKENHSESRMRWKRERGYDK
jgi:hypothetical protein